MKLKQNAFKRNLGKRQQIGLWSTLGGTVLAELLANCGYDWLLVDTEHSASEPPDVVGHLHAIGTTGCTPLVRPAWSDMVLIKRLLDAGAQTLIIPYIQSVAEAEAAVSYVRYPPRGVRGVSGSSRASVYGLAEDYFAAIEEEICVIVQIETLEAVEDLERIAQVDGVDGVFIGPADLAAAMGHLGNAQHPDVQAKIDECFRRLRAIGKPSGYLTSNEAESQRRIADGVDFIGVATDAILMTRAAQGLLSRLRPA